MYKKIKNRTTFVLNQKSQILEVVYSNTNILQKLIPQRLIWLPLQMQEDHWNLVIERYFKDNFDKAQIALGEKIDNHGTKHLLF